MGKMKVAGYVKLAKLWEKNKDKAIPYHNTYFSEKYENSDQFELYGVYVDITGNRQIEKRPEMVRLIKDCQDGKVDCISTPTKAYLAATARDFCYLIKLLNGFGKEIHLITEDEQYNIDTIVNADGQKEALLQMAEEYISLYPEDYEQWKNSLLKKCGRGGSQA